MKTKITFHLLFGAFVIWIATSIQGCAGSPLAEAPDPIADKVKYQTLSWGNAEWSEIIQMEFDEYLENFDLAQDATEFCPKYKTLDRSKRIHFWGEMVSQMAKYESAWKPDTFYRECSKKKCQYLKNGVPDCRFDETYGYCMKGGHALDGKTVVSRGLTQISLESAIAKGCAVTKPQDLHDPALNLFCTKDIMLKQITAKGRLTFDKGQYWSVLKPTGKWTKVPEIKAGIKKLGFCH